MISKQKYIVTLVIILGLVSILYFNLSQSDELKKSVSQSGTDGNTGKILNIASQSGGQWGDNPFGTGVSDSIQTPEIKDPSPNIPQPDTTWTTKTRQINGKMVTYEFGKGNPSEVALTGEALKDHWKKNAKGYMTPEAEIALKKFLSNPSLPYFINKCYKQLDWYHSNPQSAEYSRYPQNLSMEHLLYIDPETGRKEFNYDNIQVIAGTFNGMDNPLEFDESKRLWNQCLTKAEYNQHFLPLVEQFFWVWKYYGNQWDVR